MKNIEPSHMKLKFKTLQNVHSLVCTRSKTALPLVTMNTRGLSNKVRLNLIHMIQWSNMTTLSVKNVSLRESESWRKLTNPENETFLLKGTNPKNGKEEYVLALSKRTKVTLQNLDNLFKQLCSKVDEEIDRILLAIVDTDGSIMYNYISRGVRSVHNGI